MVFPTETVYGIGADACNSEAVSRIFEVKGRPKDHPLIVHIASRVAMFDWASDIPEYSYSLARDFWPGPMTLIFKRSSLAGDFITGGQETVALRVPNHPIALDLLETFERFGGKGIAAPSANRFGNVSPTNAQAVLADLDQFMADADQILDGGQCEVGVESTIIDCTREFPRILRPGLVTSELISMSTDLSVVDSAYISPKGATIRFSGSHKSHYSPIARVVLDEKPFPGSGLIAYQSIPTPIGVHRLASPKTNEEYAQILYESLRDADAKGLSTVFAHLPTGGGIAIAIRDRLQRAAYLDI